MPLSLYNTMTNFNYKTNIQIDIKQIDFTNKPNLICHLLVYILLGPYSLCKRTKQSDGKRTTSCERNRFQHHLIQSSFCVCQCKSYSKIIRIYSVRCAYVCVCHLWYLTYAWSSGKFISIRRQMNSLNISWMNLIFHFAYIKCVSAIWFASIWQVAWWIHLLHFQRFSTRIVNVTLNCLNTGDEIKCIWVTIFALIFAMQDENKLLNNVGSIVISIIDNSGGKN